MNITAARGATLCSPGPFRSATAFEASPEFERLDGVERVVYSSGQLLARGGRHEGLVGLGFGLTVAASLALAAGKLHWVLAGPGLLGYVVGSLLSREAFQAEAALDVQLEAPQTLWEPEDQGSASRVPLAAGALGVLVVAPVVLTAALAGVASLRLATGVASGLAMAGVAGAVGSAVVLAGKVGSISQGVNEARADFHSRLAASASVTDLLDGSLGDIVLAPEEVVIEGHLLPVRA